MIGDGFGPNCGYIAKWFNAKVCVVSSPSFRINIACEDTLHAQTGSGYMKSANSTEHVGECQRRGKTIYHLLCFLNFLDAKLQMSTRVKATKMQPFLKWDVKVNA